MCCEFVSDSGVGFESDKPEGSSLLLDIGDNQTWQFAT